MSSVQIVRTADTTWPRMFLGDKHDEATIKAETFGTPEWEPQTYMLTEAAEQLARDLAAIDGVDSIVFKHLHGITACALPAVGRISPEGYAKINDLIDKFGGKKPLALVAAPDSQPHAEVPALPDGTYTHMRDVESRAIPGGFGTAPGSGAPL